MIFQKGRGYPIFNIDHRSCRVIVAKDVHIEYFKINPTAA